MATRAQRITMETAGSRIVGDLTLPEESYRSRFSDFLNKQDLAFLALTDAEVTPLAGGPARRLPFLAVSRAHVQLAYELDA
ncbi:MAG: hypothetical protein WD404_04310 [Solirubrobacterales bacterium]